MEPYTSTLPITLYCGVAEVKWNDQPVTPGDYTCIAPVYGKTEHTQKESRIVIPVTTKVIQDSGAFSDGPNLRLPVETALARQIIHAHKYRYSHQITHVASYDLLIDERWLNGERFKKRWDVSSAESAVDETISNAKWIASNRHILPTRPNLILTAQGVTPQQYLYCTQNIVPYLEENDIFGLGGWCITGKRKNTMMPVLAETMQLIFPYLTQQGVTKVHVWGVLLAEALAQIGYWCKKYNIHFSTDSVGPSIRPAFGHWGYADWYDSNYTRKPSAKRGLDRIKHVELTRQWLNTFTVEKYLNQKYAQYL